METFDNKYVLNLFESAKKGNKHSFIQLCEINAQNIFSLCFRIFGDSAAAKNFTVDIFAAGWETIKQLKLHSSFSGWLQSIAVFKILEDYREKNSSTDFSQKNKEKKTPQLISTINANIGKLDSLIISLPFNERLIFIFHDLLKYSYEEISDLIPNYSVGVLKSTLKDIRRKLIIGMQ